MKHRKMSFEILKNNQESNRDTGIKNLFVNYEVSIVHLRNVANNFDNHDEINILPNMLSFRL
jgi:hypothetical protein